MVGELKPFYYDSSVPTWISLDTKRVKNQSEVLFLLPTIASSKSTYSRYLLGLVLAEKKSGKSEFERVGMFHLYWDTFGSDHLLGRWSDECHFKNQYQNSAYSISPGKASNAEGIFWDFSEMKWMSETGSREHYSEEVKIL